VATRLFALLARSRTWLAGLRPGTSPAPPPLEPPIPEVVVAPPEVPPALAIADLQAWAASNGRSVRFQHGPDRYELSAKGLRMDAGEGRWEAVSPRLAFPAEDELPYLTADRLGPLANTETPYGAVFMLDDGPPVAWDAVAAHVPPGDQGLLGETGQLLRLGLLTADQVAAALDQARPAEALDQAIARLGLADLGVWIDGLVGRTHVPPPASRSFADRVGMRLLTMGAITQGQLKEALARQAEGGTHHPVGVLLGIPETRLGPVLAGQPALHPQFAEADGLGEVLIRWGCVSRSDWLAARRAGAAPEQALVRSGKLLSSHVTRAQAYRESLAIHLAARTFRLGQILVARGLATETLAKALAWQVDQPLHLAELMILHRLLGPAEAARALGEQARKYRQAAEAGLPPLEVRRSPQPVALPGRAGPRRRFPREAILLGVAGGFALAYAVASGYRWSGTDYGWLNAFFPPPPPAPARPPGGAVHEVSEARGKAGPVAVQAVERLDLPIGRPPAPGPATAAFLAGKAPDFRPEYIPGSPAPGSVPTLAGATSDARLLGQAPLSQALPVPGALRTPEPGAVGTLAPRPRSGAPSFARELHSATIAQPTFGTLHASPGAARFAYPMEGPLVLPTPAPRPGPKDEPSVMRRFRADLARLLADEARHRNRGRTLRAAGRDSEAQLALAAAENVRRSQAVFRARIGEAHFRDGDLVAAAAELRGAAHDDPSFALPHYYLGEIAAARQDPGKADAAFKEYLRLAPEGEFAPAARSALARLGPGRIP